MDPCAHQDQPRKNSVVEPGRCFSDWVRAHYRSMENRKSSPLGHRVFVEAQVQQTGEVHAVLLSRISTVSDLQCPWLILLSNASARANHFLRVVHPSWSQGFATTHDNGLLREHSR